MRLIDILSSPGTLVADDLARLRFERDLLMQDVFLEKIFLANSIDLVLRRVVMEQRYLITDRSLVINEPGLGSSWRLWCTRRHQEHGKKSED